MMLASSLLHDVSRGIKDLLPAQLCLKFDKETNIKKISLQVTGEHFQQALTMDIPAIDSLLKAAVYGDSFGLAQGFYFTMQPTTYTSIDMGSQLLSKIPSSSSPE